MWVLHRSRRRIAWLRWGGALAVWLGLEGAAVAGDACRMQHVTDLAIMQRDGLLYSKIGINGQDALLVVDSGSEKSLLRTGSVARLGMKGSSFHTHLIEGVGGLDGAGQAIADDVQFGDAHGRRLAFWTVDGFGEKPDVDGLLAMDFFSSLDIDFDVKGGHVGLYKALDSCKQPSTALGGAIYAVDLLDDPEQDETLLPLIAVTINGAALHALIDSGAPHSAIYRTAAARAGLDTGTTDATGRLHGIGPGSVQTTVRISAPVEIGDLTFKNMPVLVIDQKRDGVVDMMLGADFLARVHVWISHSSHSLIMQYPPAATP